VSCEDELRVERTLNKHDVRAAADSAKYAAGELLMAELMLGKVQILGKPVRLEWPEGLPLGLTEDELREYALEMERCAKSITADHPPLA
jgi:hypothetical protein